MAKDMYRQYIPDINLAIERYSDNVPQDGKYYLLQNGQVLGVFKSLKQAQELFYSIVQKSGFKPKIDKIPRKSATQIGIERYLEAKDLYWAESHMYRGNGGKGGRGGV